MTVGDAPLTELGALLQLQRDLALESDVDVVLQRIAAAATTLLDAERATLYVVDAARQEIWSRAVTQGEFRELRIPLDGPGLAAAVARDGRTLRVDHPYDDPRFDPSVDARTGYRTRSLLVLPIDSRAHERLGVLQAVNQRGGAFDERHGAIGEGLAASAGLALEYVRLTTELAAERLREVRIAEETRHRLARDLHDGVAQTLASTALAIELAQKRARTDLPGALEELAHLREKVLEAQRGLRELLFELRPVVLEEQGLASAVLSLVERTTGSGGARVVARDVALTTRYAPEVETGAFHVVREAISNAIKTGRATAVLVDLRDDSGTLVAEVEDDGVGFDVASTLATYSSRGSLGLLQMREAARQIGGRLVIDSSPGHGTRIRLHVPPAAGA
ncbi:MAG: GAF domain-containing sensor histidine kinase [Chloroflexota bacterium]|nr:GAF domain-containing sensor histidine kinase [Chloroflexota bacterium]